MARHSLIVGAGLVLAIVLGSTVNGGGKVDPVKVKAMAGKASAADKQVVIVTLNIDKGWHVYANPVGHEDLVSAETTVKVSTAGKAIPAKLKYPDGTPHTDKLLGTFRIYENQVNVEAEFPRTDSPVDVSVTFQACDAVKCLQPKTVKLTVK
jgi:hypothetical protein